MKILVCNPPWPGKGYGARTGNRFAHRRGDKSLEYPIYLAYTIGLLKKYDFIVKGYDAVEKEIGINAFVEWVKSFSPDLILMEVSTPSIMFDLETAQKLKKETDAYIVFVGAHATYFHKELVADYRFLDACIRREWDKPFLELALALRENKSLNSIKGITFDTGNSIEINEDNDELFDVNRYPFADREEFEIEDYQQRFFLGHHSAVVKATWSCPFKCAFCLFHPLMFGTSTRVREPQLVLDEIEYLINTHKIDWVFFEDSTFTVTKKYVIDFCNQKIKRGIDIRWGCLATVNIIDEDTVQLLAKSGCTQIFYGFESGSAEILKNINKPITTEQMIKAVNLTKKYGMVASGSFIIGLPGESEKTIKETWNVMKQLKADYLQFCVAAPYPGSRLYEELKEKGLIRTRSWSDFDHSRGFIFDTENMSAQQLSGIIRKFYIKYYTNPGVIWASLKKMRDYRNIKRIFRGFLSVLSRIFYYK